MTRIRSALAVASLAVMLGVAALLTLLWLIGLPMYTPGQVATSGLELHPPPQENSERWRVEPTVELAYFASGEGSPVLFVHGLIPRRQPALGLENLDRRVYYPHLRGSGDSTRPFDRFGEGSTYEHMTSLEGTLGFGAQIADIERIRQLLGEEQLTLVGHSFGGLVAALYAAEFPSHVSQLVLIAPAEVLVMPPPSGGLYGQVRDRLDPSEHEDYDALIDQLLDFGGMFEHSEAELLALEASFFDYYRLIDPTAEVPRVEDMGAWQLRAMFLGLGMRHDWRPALGEITARTLVVHGTEDHQPIEASAMYSEAIADAAFETIDGAGHFPHDTHPEAFAEVVSRFLDHSNSTERSVRSASSGTAPGVSR